MKDYIVRWDEQMLDYPSDYDFIDSGNKDAKNKF